MKIKIETIIGAIPALRKLNELDLPLTKSFEVFGLVGAADKALSFFTEKREIISITISDDLRLSAADIRQLMPFTDFKAPEKE